MQFEYDPDRLIEEVRKRPAIWDFENIDYRSKENRHKMWNEIVDELLEPGVSINKSEKRELELQLQKKWKSIRDCFHKYLQRPNRTKRPYIYFKQLQFIMKTPTKPEPETSYAMQNDGASSGSDDGKQNKKWKTKKKLVKMKLVKDEDSSADEANDSITYQEEMSYSNDDTEINIPSKIQKTDTSTDEFAFASYDSRSEVEDCDKMFLLSLIPHLKAIPEEFRLDAKMEMMQVLRNVKYNGIHQKIM